MKSRFRLGAYLCISVLAVLGVGMIFREQIFAFASGKVQRTIDVKANQHQTETYALQVLGEELHDVPQAKWYVVSWQIPGGGTTSLVYDASAQRMMINTTCGDSGGCHANTVSFSGLTSADIDRANAQRLAPGQLDYSILGRRLPSN